MAESFWAGPALLGLLFGLLIYGLILGTFILGILYFVKRSWFFSIVEWIQRPTPPRGGWQHWEYEGPRFRYRLKTIGQHPDGNDHIQGSENTVYGNNLDRGLKRVGYDHTPTVDFVREVSLKKEQKYEMVFDGSYRGDRGRRLIRKRRG